MNNIKVAIKEYLKEKEYNKFTLKSVLFDMDGVLYDSMPNHASSWTKVMQLYGFNMTEEEAYMHEGRKGVETISIISGREGKNISLEEGKKIYETKIKIFNSCPTVLPMKGSTELLCKIVENELFAMLVTGSGQPSLLERLNNDFPNIFLRERVVSSFDVKNGKPNPEPYLTAMKKGLLQPDEAIVVENAPLGIESAHSAGLFVIAVNTGPLPDSALLDAGANILLPSIECLYDEWNNIFHYLRTTLNHINYDPKRAYLSNNKPPVRR